MGVGSGGSRWLAVCVMHFRTLARVLEPEVGLGRGERGLKKKKSSIFVNPDQSGSHLLKKRSAEQ